MLIDVLSSPIYYTGNPNKFSITVDTGSTGKCRLAVFIPKGVDPATAGRRGVVMHLHGGGWTMYVLTFCFTEFELVGLTDYGWCWCGCAGSGMCGGRRRTR